MEETLFQMMAGACEVLAESGCSLVGGHTCEGSEQARASLPACALMSSLFGVTLALPHR